MTNLLSMLYFRRCMRCRETVTHTTTATSAGFVEESHTYPMFRKRLRSIVLQDVCMNLQNDAQLQLSLLSFILVMPWIYISIRLGLGPYMLLSFIFNFLISGFCKINGIFAPNSNVLLKLLFIFIGIAGNIRLMHYL